MLGRLNGWIALLGVACSGPSKDTDAGDTDTEDKEDPDTDEPEPTGETGEPDPYFRPTMLHVSGEFGWDAANARLVDVGTPYGAFPSRIILRFADDGWPADNFALDSDAYCEVDIPLTVSDRAAWVDSSASYWFGFETDPSEGVLTNCNLGDGVHDFDPADWGDAFPADLAGLGWGLGIGEINARWSQEFEGSEFEGNVFGGVIPTEMLPYGHDDYFASARTIDASFDVVLDGNNYILLQTSEVLQPPNIATAWYAVDTTDLWGAGR